MPKQETKPQSLISFINYLKTSGLCIYIDKQGDYLYYPTSNIKVNLSHFKRLFKKYCCDLEFDEWGEYAKACLPCIIGKKFLPSQSELIPIPEDLNTFYLNTFKKHITSTDNCTPDNLWFEYLERLFPLEDERKIVIKYLAHIFQYPEQRPSWHLLLTSDTGTGKGFLFNDVLSPLLENQTSLCADYSTFMNQFSTALNGTLLCLLDDPKTNSDHTQTKLKSKLSEERQLVELKYEQPVMQNIYTRVILASNENRPLMLDENERRWFVPQKIEHKIDRLETQQFITKLFNYISTGGLDVIYNWFMVQDLSDFNHKYCPTTDTLNHMIEISVPMLQSDIEEWLEEHDVFQWEELKSHFPNEADNLLRKYVVEAGYNTKRLSMCGKKTKYWYADSVEIANWTPLRTPQGHPTLIQGCPF